jgi:hypothetical protein
LAGEETHIVELKDGRQSFKLPLKAEAREVALDPDLRIFRRLGPDEAPPILREVMVDAATATVLLSIGGPERAAGEALASKLQDHSPDFASTARLPQKGPVLVIGLARDVDAWLTKHHLPPRPAEVRAQGTAQVWTARSSGRQTIAVISATDASALNALLRPLPHYGRQSYLVFDGAKAVTRGTWPAQVQTIRFE